MRFLFSNQRFGMKYKNQQIVAYNTSVAVLQRGDEEYPFTLSCVDYDFDKKLREFVIPQIPKTPREYVRDPKTNAFIRDDSGRVEERPVKDPEVEKQQGEWYLALLSARVANALRNDPNTEFDTAPPTEDTKDAWKQYVFSIKQELLSVLTEEEMTKFWEVSQSLECRVTVEKAVEDFLSRQRM